MSTDACGRQYGPAQASVIENEECHRQCGDDQPDQCDTQPISRLIIRDQRLL